MKDAPNGLLRNEILARLPADELRAILPLLSSVPLRVDQVIYEPGDPIEHAYFPVVGMISRIAGDGRMHQVEVGTIGREGVVGAAAAFDRTPIAFLRHLVQLPGEAYRIPASALNRAGADLPVLYDFCCRYAQATLAQAEQSAACNLLHSLSQRAAKWILLAHDQLEGDEVALKHEFLAGMLGVHRPMVTVTLGRFEQAGSIRTLRGRIIVQDRQSLERAACGCYQVIAAEFARLLAPPSLGRTGYASINELARRDPPTPA